MGSGRGRDLNLAMSGAETETATMGPVRYQFTIGSAETTGTMASGTSGTGSGVLTSTSASNGYGAGSLDTSTISFTVDVMEAPVPVSLVDEIQPLWEEAFAPDGDGHAFDSVRVMLLGGAVADMRDVLYVARDTSKSDGGQGTVAGTCILTAGRTVAGRKFGGLGEVLTSARYRRRGVALALVGCVAHVAVVVLMLAGCLLCCAHCVCFGK